MNFKLQALVILLLTILLGCSTNFAGRPVANTQTSTTTVKFNRCYVRLPVIVASEGDQQVGVPNAPIPTGINAYESKWSGVCVNGVAQGQGIAKWSNCIYCDEKHDVHTAIYSGGVVNGLVHGNGATFKEGRMKFEGAVRNGHPVLGSVRWFDSATTYNDYDPKDSTASTYRYEGTFWPSGNFAQGVIFYQNGDLFAGEWKNWGRGYSPMGVSVIKQNGVFYTGYCGNGNTNGPSACKVQVKGVRPSVLSQIFGVGVAIVMAPVAALAIGALASVTMAPTAGLSLLIILI